MWSIDDIVNNIDVADIEKKYAEALAQPMAFSLYLCKNLNNGKNTIANLDEDVSPERG